MFVCSLSRHEVLDAACSQIHQLYSPSAAAAAVAVSVASGILVEWERKRGRRRVNAFFCLQWLSILSAIPVDS